MQRGKVPQLEELFPMQRCYEKEWLNRRQEPQGPTVSSTILITSKNVESDPEPEDAGEEHVPPPPEINLGDAFAQATINSATTGVGTPKKKSKKMKGQKISLTSPAGRGPMLD